MKLNNISKLLFFVNIVILINLNIVFNAFGFGVETHKAINSFIADESSSIYGSYLHIYLQKNIGLQDGIKTIFDSKMAKTWISDGGVHEDAGGRSVNHFHNPLTNRGLFGNYSAMIWATLPTGAQQLQNYSWNDVRDYYLQALTAREKTKRDNWFALTFRGVGQIMHLVQDMSVPAHVRADIHPPPFWNDGYEEWAKEHINDASKVTAYPAYSLYTPFDHSSFLIPLLFDTDQYTTGADPGITMSSRSIGLAEYTNANFFSGDTINAKQFPHPKTDHSQKITKEHTGREGTYQRKYFRRDCVGDYCAAGGDKTYDGYLLSAVDLNDYWRLKNPNSADSKPVIPILDENVHQDYAQLLIPRAIGYSAQALQYFFRGSLDARLVEGSLIIRNTSDETISNGLFSLYYDNESGERGLLATAQADTLLSGDEQTIAVGSSESASSYMLVFKGRLGNETEAVIGKYISAASSRIAIVSTATNFIKLKLGSISEQGIKLLSECVMKGVTLSNADDLASVQVIWDPLAGCYQVFIGNNSSAPYNMKYAVDMDGEIISSKEANFNALPNRYYNIAMAKDAFDTIYYRFAGPGAYALLDHEFNIMKGESPVAGSMQDPYLAYRVTKYPTYSLPQPPAWNSSILKTLLDDGTMVIMHGWLSYEYMREWRIIYEDSATHEAKEFLMKRDAYSTTSKFSLSNRFLQVDDQLWYVAMTEQVVNTNYRFGLYYYLDTVYTNELRIAALDNPLDFVVAQTEASTFVGSGVHTYWTYSSEGGWVSHEITYRAPTNAVIITRMTYCKKEGIVLISKVRWDNTGIVDWEAPPTGPTVYPDAPKGTLTTYIDAYNTKGVFLYRTIMEQIEVPSVWSYSPFKGRTSMPVQIPLDEWNSYIRHTSIGYTQMD